MRGDQRKDEIVGYSRMAGLAYLVTISLGIFSVNFALDEIVVNGDTSTTINNILANERLFRIGIVSEILMYAIVVLLAHALYVVLRSVNSNLALLALLWRLAEAIVGSSATVISGILPLLLLKTDVGVSVSHVSALVATLLELRPAALDVVLIFIGMGGTIFCYLFFRSNFVPKVLALWGIVTYIVMLVVSVLSLLTPVSAEAKMWFYVPGGLFEITFGLWLLFRGVKVVELNEGK